MPTHIKIIHAHEFIKATPKGQLNMAESKKLLTDAALFAGPLNDHEIILDTRKVNSILTKTELWELSKELCKFHQRFNHKIAVVCPAERFDFRGSLPYAPKIMDFVLMHTLHWAMQWNG